MRYILYILIIISISFSRENPFDKAEKTRSIFLNNDRNNLHEQYFNLPDDAREIKEIIIKYKTLDGSREAKIIDINKRIDWRVPILISQQKRKTKVQIQQEFVEFVPFKFIKYRVTDDEVLIFTSASNMRHFMLPNPYKLIMDFSYDSYFKTHTEKITKSFKTKSIATGSHAGFFRVALELVGKYKYKVTKIRNGYKITFE